MGHFLLVFCLESNRTGVLSLFQHFLICLQHSGFHLLVFVAGGSGFLRLGQLSLDGFQVFQLQFGVDDLLVFHGVHRGTSFAHHIIVVEAAQHMDDSIGFADVPEEFITESLALRRTFHQSGNVDNLARGGHDASGMNNLCQTGEPLVGHGDYAHVGLNRTEGEVSCLCLGTRQTIEKRGFSHIGQSHDTTF